MPRGRCLSLVASRHRVLASATVADATDSELTLGSARGRIALVATVGASGMAMLDATVVNVALPHIGADFHANVSALQWVLTGYLLALASLILLGGALGDRFGRRRVFVIGTAWFSVASILCGVAPNIETLVIARVLQGIGGALLTPGSLAILQASFRERDRAPAVGAWSGLGGIAGAIGPFLGGVLVDGPGWRWAFLINLPLAVAVIVCARVAVPETRDPHATGSLDVIGVLLAVAALSASTWALTEAGPRGWTDAAVLGAAGVAVVAIVGFVLRMLRARDPLVPPALFRNRAFRVTNYATVLLYGALGVTFFLIAYELQVASGWSALRSGTALLPVTIIMLIFSAPSGALAQRIGPRLQLTVGPIVVGIGLLLFTRIGPNASWFSDVLPGALVFAVGLVAFVAPLTATVMAAADPDHVSVASGVNNAIARTASLASLAVVPVVAGLAAASGAREVTTAFRAALVIVAIVAACAGPLCFVGLRADQRTRRSARRVVCPVDGAPIQPDPEQCPEPERVRGGRAGR